MKPDAELIGPLLRDVSRSFYLTLRMLPAPLRAPVSVAYLLARATDTIADTDAVPRAKRIGLLRQFQNLTRPPDLGALSGQQASAAERRLLEKMPEIFQTLDQFSEADCRRIRDLLEQIITGQIFDLQQFPEGRLTALQDEAQLDQYTYLVAGCVGEFWTRMCAAYVSGWPASGMEEKGVRFGKGLQLVNILRDLPKDLRLGRCYLPLAQPERLLDPARFAEVRDVYQHWLAMAADHLTAGWEYVLAIPRREHRLRLACVWPIWIGQQTLARLGAANPLDPAQRIKITRAEVYRLLARSVWCNRSAAALTREFQRLRQSTVCTRQPTAV
jgi:farnesyl-diphosphate farnesyltransferase